MRKHQEFIPDFSLNKIVLGFIKRNILMIIICGAAVLLRFIFYKPYPPGWDSSVYLMMGKFLVSGGAVGFSEAFRPLPWPFFLGLLWKIGWDPAVTGSLVEILFTVGDIILVYLIGRKVFNSTVGWVAALLLSTSSSFFFWGHSLYTDIPASFFGLFAIYLFSKNRFLWAGGMGAFAFFTKFTQIIPVAVWAVVSCGMLDEKKRFYQLRKFVTGFGIMTISFLTWNAFLYHHPLYPFYAMPGIYAQVPHEWHKEIGYCVRMLFKIEGWIFIFVPLSLLIFRQKNWQHIGMLCVALLSFASIMKLPTYFDLPRFFILALPYLYILSAYGIVEVFAWLKKRPVHLSYVFFAVIAVYSVLQFHRLTQIPFRQDDLGPLRAYLIRNEENLHGPIWVSNPGIVSSTNLKIDELMYYPIFDLQKASRLLQELPTAGLIALDSRGLVCRPPGDVMCEEARQRLIEKIKEDFDELVKSVVSPENVTTGIFKRRGP